MPRPNRNFFVALWRVIRLVGRHIPMSPLKANYVALLLAATVMLLHFVPEATVWLQYHRAAIADGQVWRLLTSHWVHYDADHLKWNLITLVSSSIVAERLDRKRFVLYLLIAMPVVGIATFVFSPQIHLAAGYSGLATGVLALILLGMARMNWQAEPWVSIVAMLLFFLFLANETGNLASVTPYEALTGRSTRPEVGAQVVAAHLQGMVVGILVALPKWPESRWTAEAKP
jgi:rhomboid family GlyGly-CTERM serine protease